MEGEKITKEIKKNKGVMPFHQGEKLSDNRSSELANKIYLIM